MNNLIIKPLTEDYKEVYLRTTQLEWAMWPFPFEQKDEFIKGLVFEYWNICHNIFQIAWLVWRSAAVDVQNWYISKIQWYMNELEARYEKLPTVYDNFSYLLRVSFPKNHWIEYWLQFPCQEIERKMEYRVECGKYLVIISWTCDHVWDFLELNDLKTASELWEKDVKEVYTKDNYLESKLSEKMQWYVYPLMYRAEKGISIGEFEFNYIIWVKEKVKKKEKELEKQTLKCIVDLQRAQEKLKEVLVFYFTYCFNYAEYLQTSKRKDVNVLEVSS